MANTSRPTETNCPSTDGHNSRLTRRSYVRSIAAVAAATTGVAAAGSASADQGYETVSLDAGEDRTIRVESGDTLENVCYDCTASNARVTVAAHGTDWTIRNVAVAGTLDVGKPAAVFGISDTEGGTSTFENVYLGDGSENAGQSTAETGIWVNPEHSGHLDVRHVNVQGFPDNGIYASAPGTGGGGTVHIDECFAANNHVANFRIGSKGSKVTNSNVLLDDEGYDGRGIWAWAPGPIDVENCQVQTNGNHYAIQAGANGDATTVAVAESDFDTGFHGGLGEKSGSTVDLDETVGNDPEAVIPDGVPTSHEEAAGE